MPRKHWTPTKPNEAGPGSNPGSGISVRGLRTWNRRQIGVKSCRTAHLRTILWLAPLACEIDWASKVIALQAGARTVPDTAGQPVISLLIVLAAGMLLVAFCRTRLSAVAVGVAAGAGAANLLERLVDGQVTNFIPLPGGLWCDPADLLLYGSVGLLVWTAFLVWRSKGAWR